ncbi:unnamed protein product, partial [Allacma fusca]
QPNVHKDYLLSSNGDNFLVVDLHHANKQGLPPHSSSSTRNINTKNLSQNDYHDQLSKGILAAASQALEATVKSSTERENITAHLEKCLGTQLSVFINKNKGTLDRDLEECKRATQEGIEWFESNFQKRLESLPSTVLDVGDVDEYIETLARKSTRRTYKHLAKMYNNINEKELTFRIEDLVNDQREEVSETVFKTVTFIKGDSRILKHRDVNINTEKKEAKKHDGSQSENSDSEESSKWTGEKNGVLDAIKSNDNNILIQQEAQLSQHQQPHSKLQKEFQTQQQQQPHDQLQQQFWTQQQQQPLTLQQQKQQTLQQQQPQTQQQQQPQTQQQQQPQQPESPLPDHKTPPLTRQRQQEQQKPPSVPPRQKNPQTQLPHLKQLEVKGNDHLNTPQLSHSVNPQVDTKHSSQEDNKNKPIKGFRHAVSSIKKDLKKINVSKLSNLVGEVARKEPTTNDTPAVVPLSNLYKTGVRAHSPEEFMQTTKLTSKEMNQMSTFSGEKQPTIGFLITNSRVYVLQRTADRMLGIVRSFQITLSFECPKIELNGNVNQVLVEFNVLDLLGTNRRVYIDRYEVAAEDLICEYFCQIAMKIVEEDNITNENAIIIQSAHLSNFQTQRLKAVLNGINFQSQQLMSLHSLVASSLCQNLGKGSPAETYLIIHFTNKEFEAAVASVSYSSANILGYADYRDIPDFNVNSQLFLHNHRELCSKAATNSNLPSETITKALDFYNQILEKTLTALKPQQSQMIKTVYIVIERNLSPLKQYLKTRLALLKNRTIEAIFEDEVLGTTGLPSVPCDDLYKHNLWILLNNATSKLRLLEKSKPFPRKEFTKEFQLPLPPLQPTFDLFSSNDERKSYRFESDYSKPLKLMLTTFADGTYHIRFKNPTDQFISFHDFPSS